MVLAGGNSTGSDVEVLAENERYWRGNMRYWLGGDRYSRGRGSTGGD